MVRDSRRWAMAIATVEADDEVELVPAGTTYPDGAR
jgi:hypothetical protein